MIGGVTHHMLPHLPGVPHLHVNRPLEGKTTTLRVHHTFLYISLTFWHDYDMQLPNFTFYERRKQVTTKKYFSF